MSGWCQQIRRNKYWEIPKRMDAKHLQKTPNSSSSLLKFYNRFVLLIPKQNVSKCLAKKKKNQSVQKVHKDHKGWLPRYCEQHEAEPFQPRWKFHGTQITQRGPLEATQGDFKWTGDQCEVNQCLIDLSFWRRTYRYIYLLIWKHQDIKPTSNYQWRVLFCLSFGRQQKKNNPKNGNLQTQDDLGFFSMTKKNESLPIWRWSSRQDLRWLAMAVANPQGLRCNLSESGPTVRMVFISRLYYTIYPYMRFIIYLYIL